MDFWDSIVPRAAVVLSWCVLLIASFQVAGLSELAEF
jgi:hypothetical protein